MRKKYLTEDKFNDWKGNDFEHLCKKMRWVNLKLTFILAFMGLTLGLIGVAIAL